MGGGGHTAWHLSGATGAARMRYRRDAEEEPKEEEEGSGVMDSIKETEEKMEEEIVELEHKAEEALKPVAEMTHMQPW